MSHQYLETTFKSLATACSGPHRLAVRCCVSPVIHLAVEGVGIDSVWSFSFLPLRCAGFVGTNSLLYLIGRSCRAHPIRIMSSPSYRKTRFVCISDTHNASPATGAFKLPKGDVLIHAGDMTREGTPAELRRNLDWIENTDFEAQIVVAGNFHLPNKTGS